MTFGDMLSFLMSEQGITAAELSRRSGVPQSTITEMLKGRTREPSFSRANRLARALGVSLDRFVELTESDDG